MEKKLYIFGLFWTFQIVVTFPSVDACVTLRRY